MTVGGDVPTAAVPRDLSQHFKNIRGTDPRFKWLLQHDQTFDSAIETGLLDSELVQEGVEDVRDIIALETIEEQMHHLVECAYVEVYRKAPTAVWLAALEARFGITQSPATLDSAGRIANVTRERMRQVSNRVAPLLDGAWIPSMEDATRVLVDASVPRGATNW